MVYSHSPISTTKLSLKNTHKFSKFSTMTTMMLQDATRNSSAETRGEVKKKLLLFFRQLFFILFYEQLFP